MLETFRSVLDEVVFSFQFKACQSAYFDAVYSLHCSDAALIARDRNTQVVSRILYTEIRNTSKQGASNGTILCRKFRAT